MSRFVSVGECMIEMSGGDEGNYRLGYAGDTLNTAWYARARLPAEWDVDYVTALGDDIYSQRMAQFFDHYLKDAPAPAWMEVGVPAIRKGIDWGFGEF